MKRSQAMNILSSRAVLGVGVYKNVPVTNVSFTNENGDPFVWESGDNEGEPYAIANINAMNEYGKQKAQELFTEGEYQLACNTNLSARVSIEKGRQLVNSLVATVKTELREIDVKDENGEPTGETEMAVLIAKIVPAEAIDFSSKKAEFDFGEEPTEEDNAQPRVGASAQTQETE